MQEYNFPSKNIDEKRMFGAEADNLTEAQFESVIAAIITTLADEINS